MMKKYICLLLIFVFVLFVTGVCSAKELLENKDYKNWCEKTFDNGKYIYEGYKDIAFNIKYTPEKPRVDFWQTPSDTIKLEKGDCEDIVFLFFSHLPPKFEGGEIVWGWVINNETRIAKAHVWYQLKDREGKKYIVEGFSKDWNGIIPMETIVKTETRRSILTISNLELNCLYNIASGFESLRSFAESAELHCIELYEDSSKYVGNTYAYIDAINRLKQMEFDKPINMKQKFDLKIRNNKTKVSIIIEKEIYKIFRKLHGLLGRYKKEGRIEIGF